MSEAYTNRFLATGEADRQDFFAAEEGRKDFWNTDPDPVEHPQHYCKGGIECIDAIRASMSKEAFAGYCKGNCLKYLWRYEAKGGVESLRKAEVYLKWLIEAEEAKA